MVSIGVIAFVAFQTVALVGSLATARTIRAIFRRAPRLLLAGALAGVVVVIPATAVLTGRTAETTRPVADNCLITAPNGIVVPVCGPGLSGGSVSAGAPSQELITLKNWCNLYIGGCSSAFYYPPGPARRAPVDNTVRHNP